MAETKHIVFRAPYLSSTFNKRSDLVFGGNGVLSGMKVTDIGGGMIDVDPGSFVANGLLTEFTATTVITVPSFSVPFHLLVSTADNKAATPVIFTFASELEEITDPTVIVATNDGTEWINTEKISIDAVFQELHARGTQVDGKGVYEGFRTLLNTGLTDFETDPGTLIDGLGARFENTEKTSFPVGVLDPDFERRDVVAHRRLTDDLRRAGFLKRLVGHTFSRTTGFFTTLETLLETNVSSSGGASTGPKGVAIADNGIFYFWEEGGDLLRIKYASDRTTVVLASATYETGGSSIDVFIDSANVIHTTYLVGGTVIYKRISSTGSTLVAAAGVESLPGSSSSPSISVDKFLRPHIVFSNGGDIYHVRLDDVTGAVAIGPTNLTSDGDTNITPSIKHDSDLFGYIAYENDTADEIKLLVIDRNGAISTTPTVISDDSGGNFGTGSLTAFGITITEQPLVGITDVDDVYVTFLQERSGTGGKKSTVLFNSRFKAVNGFEALGIGLSGINLGFGQTGYGTSGYGRPLVDSISELLTLEDSIQNAFEIDQFHNLHINVIAKITGGDEFSVLHTKLNNRVFLESRFLVQHGPDTIKTATLATPLSDPDIIFDSAGSLLNSWGDATDVFFNKSTAGIFATGYAEPDQEVFIAEMNLPDVSIALLEDAPVTSAAKQNVKSLTRVITVGQGDTFGDFSGAHGIRRALDELKGLGGKVEIRAGIYDIGESLEIFSSIEVVAQGNVLIRKAGGVFETFTMSGRRAGITAFAAATFEDSTVDLRALGFIVGDVVEILDVGDAVILTDEIRAISSVAGPRQNTKVHLSSTVPGAAFRYIIYRTGSKLIGVNMDDNAAGGHVLIDRGVRCEVKDCVADNSAKDGIKVRRSFDCVIKENYARGNTFDGILVDDAPGGVIVVNNFTAGNSGTADIEFTATTTGNFVANNKGVLVDSGTSNT